jgi:hypothetical protein
MKQYKRQFDKQNLIVNDKFLPGALVMAKNELRATKTEERWTGPFKVKRRSESGKYLLVDAVGTEFARPPSSLKLVTATTSLDAAEVEEILQDRVTETNTFEYLVKWKNILTEPQWLKSADFHDLTPIRKYLESRLRNKNRKDHERIDQESRNEHKSNKRPRFRVRFQESS